MYLSERLFKYNKILVFLLFLFLITIPFSFANDVDENVTLSQDLFSYLRHHAVSCAKSFKSLKSAF